MKTLFALLFAFLALFPSVSEAGGSVVKAAPKVAKSFSRSRMVRRAVVVKAAPKVAKSLGKAKVPRRVPVTRPRVSRPEYRASGGGYQDPIVAPCTQCGGSGHNFSGSPCSACGGRGVRIVY